jgi:cytoskeletal protein CcmA (bactofilin family)
MRRAYLRDGSREVSWATTTVDATSVVKATLQGDDDVLVGGQVEGAIHISGSLVVEGSVNGDVLAQLVRVRGEIRGDIVAAQRVEVHSTGVVVGDIAAPRIDVAEGARIKGSITIGRAPDVSRSGGEAGASRCSWSRPRGERTKAPLEARGALPLPASRPPKLGPAAGSDGSPRSVGA